MGSDPKELRAAITDLARHAESSASVDQVHWDKLQELSETLDETDQKLDKVRVELVEEIERVEGNTLSLAAEHSKLDRRILKIEVKMAIYAALGAAAGSTITALLIKVVFK